MSEALAEREDAWADWTTEQLRDYEQSLYDQELAGENTWEVRDAILWELNRRNFK